LGGRRSTGAEVIGAKRKEHRSTPKNLIAKVGIIYYAALLRKLFPNGETQALEERFRPKFLHLRILRIDSESVADSSED
jgi:hypothetical protein